MNHPRPLRRSASVHFQTNLLAAFRGRWREAALLSLTMLALGALASDRCVAEELHVRTNYHALVLYYNPHVEVKGERLTVRQAYNYRDIDVLCRDYITFLRRASGGQVNFSVVAKYELDEFPPENDPDVTFTTENYDQYKKQGYDIFNTSKADYLSICRDPRFKIVPRVEAGEVDAIWIFGPDCTGFWETAMAGKDAYWVNGAAYPEVDCSKRFVLYGFGMAAHQGVGFMFENTAHMTENILGNRIASGWPAARQVNGWSSLDLNNPNRARVTHQLNDWEFFTVSDAVHWNAKLTAPGRSQAGLSHFPPTACVNYGWSAVDIDFDAPWHAEHFKPYGGAWRVDGGSYSVTGGASSKAILYGSHDLEDSRGKYGVPVIITDADIGTEILITPDAPPAHAGLLLRCSRYEGTNSAEGYYVGVSPERQRVQLARVNGAAYTALAEHRMQLGAAGCKLFVSLKGATIRVSLSESGPAVITYTNATDIIDGSVGLASYGGDASFARLSVTPVIANHAESWRTYPDLGQVVRTLSPLEWRGDGKPYEDNDYWFAWWYEHLPKQPGTHEVRDPSTGAVLGKALNSWWPYIFDINRFDTPFLPEVTVVSAPADTVEPAAPTNVRCAAESASKTRVEWDEPDDDVGVTRYEVFRNGQLLRETPLRYFADANLTPNTPYAYTIKARDGSGNVSLPSAEATVTTAPSDPIPVGVARVDITPDYPVRLSGFGNRRTESEGVTQRIWAKALVIPDPAEGPAVLITTDNLCVPDEITKEIARRLGPKIGLNAQRLTITAAHTHTAPMLKDVCPTLFGVPIPVGHQVGIDRYTAEFVDKLEQVALAAVQDIRPSRLSWGKGAVTFAANRRTQGGPVDHELPVLAIHDADGQLRAVYFSYACHCVTLSNNKISGDWAGFAQQSVEDQFPGAIALASVGCGADSNPSSGVTGDNVVVCAQQGQQIADEVRRLIKGRMTPLHTAPAIRYSRVELDLDAPRSRAEWETRAERRDAIGFHARVNLARLDRGESLPTKLNYPIQTWVFGDTLAIVFLPGETVVDYSLRLKREFDGARLWVNGYSNDGRCYIPSERVLKEGGYEGGDAMIYYDVPQRFAPGLEERIVNVVRDQSSGAFERGASSSN